jgi:hypothetical protein
MPLAGKGSGFLQLLSRLLISMALSAVLVATGCARRSASDITGQLAPFMHARDQAVANTSAGKASLDAASLGQLDICYSDLRTKAGQYVDHIVGVVQSGSFDAGQNQSDERNLGVSIASYNDCLLKLQKASSAATPAPSMSVLDTNWVPAFGRAVETYWTRDGTLVRSLSPDGKAHLSDQIKTMTSWPDFATIGGGTPPPPS